jgi:all-trans-retinol 13,14-reductase
MAKKERYWSKKAPEQSWDAIVIGSGMGGMTTAAILAKLGKKVLVLEQHYVPGGFTHAFRRKGYTWDVGVHAVGEVTQHSMPGRLLHHLTDGKLRWASLGEHYEEFYYPGDMRIDFPNHPDKFKKNLLEAFPAEEAAIGAYFKLVRDVARSMKGYYLSRITSKGLAPVSDWFFAKEARRYLGMRTEDVVASLTDNAKLRTLLTAQWGYYGSLPSQSSFAIQALVVKHFWHGGYYPEGGSEEIARCLLRTVADAGGWTRIVADVDEILVEGGAATGVRMCSGEEIRAPLVVSAAGIMSTLKRLLPAAHRDDEWVGKALADVRPSPAHVCLYIGFKGDIRAQGAGSANKWFWRTWDSETSYWDIGAEGELPECPLLYCSFPSLKDPLHDPGSDVRHTGEVVTFVPWELFEPWKGTDWRKRGEDYEALKKKIQDKVLAQFLEHMPQLRDMIDYCELSTPLSTETFCRPMNGAIYGIEPTPERFENPWLRPNAPIRNLFFSGSEVASVGVIGAMMGGVLAAAAAEPLAVMRMLRRVG